MVQRLPLHFALKGLHLLASKSDIEGYAKDRALLGDVVRAAGGIAKEAFNANNAKVWDKEKGHPVTDADIAVNDFLARELLAARPDYGWLSEETKDDNSRRKCQKCFVVDPIDGTRAFIERTPNFSVSVAIIEDGVSVAGVVYNPLKDEMYAAHLTGGATLNGVSITTSRREVLKGARIVGYARKFRRLGWPDMNVSVINSMAYRMVKVACGDEDAAVAFTPKSDWDVAAAELICTEAGALVTNLRGEKPRYDQDSVSGLGIICAGPALHALIRERVEPVISKFKMSPDPIKDFGFLGTRMTDRKDPEVQLLHLVIGGELIDPMRTNFRDLNEIDFVGAFPNFETARAAWKAAAQRTVDNAHMRYFILHAHELIDPDKDGIIG